MKGKKSVLICAMVNVIIAFVGGGISVVMGVSPALIVQFGIIAAVNIAVIIWAENA